MPPRGPGQSRSTLAVLAVVSVTVLVVDLLGVAPLGTLRDAVSGVLSPVRAVGDAVFGGDDSGEVEELRARVAELEGTEARLANLQAELARLREQLNITPPEGVAAVAAQVIGVEISNFDRTIEIDRGADQGIEPGMAVQTERGLVGRVDRVSFTSARIELISSPDLEIGIRHVPSRDVAVCRGQGEGRTLVVENAFEAATPVSEGDLFVTAGLEGSGVPGGIPVGRAVAVGAAANPLEQQVELEALEDLDSITDVAVLLHRSASEEDG